VKKKEVLIFLNNFFQTTKLLLKRKAQNKLRLCKPRQINPNHSKWFPVAARVCAAEATLCKTMRDFLKAGSSIVHQPELQTCLEFSLLHSSSWEC